MGDVLGALDFKEQTKHMEATEKAHKLTAQKEENDASDASDSMKAVQEELWEKEREVRRLKVRLEQLARMREEYRVWAENQQDEARSTAEAAEDAVRAAALIAEGPTLRDAAEVDDLRLLLKELSADLESDRKLIESKIQQEHDAQDLHQKS